MEVIDLGVNELEPISISIDERPSVNFGLGAELLMNAKRSDNNSKMNIDLGELDKLETELNELSKENEKQNSTSTFTGFTSNLFGFGGNSSSNAPSSFVKSEEQPSAMEADEPSLGQATANSMGGFTKTFDGFMKMGEIPTGENTSSSSGMNDREKRRKKRMMIKKLEEWYEKGIIKHHSHFNMDSSYEEIEDEYESALEDKRLKDSVKLQGWWFMTFINSLEYANSAFDPFDLNLDGWAEQVSEDLDSYEEIFTELHHKYKGGKLSPEISLILRLGFSAAVTNFTNKALSTATPGFNDVMKQNPDLMKAFTNATVETMRQNSPGFQFVNNVLNKEPEVNTSFGPPPVPVQTKIAPPSQRGDPRPDIEMARASGSGSGSFSGSGAMNSFFGSTMFRERGVDVNTNDAPIQNSNARPEMRGPQNIDMVNILSGLKPQQQQTQQAPPSMPAPQVVSSSSIIQENDSMISATSMREMMKNSSNAPKRNNRRKTSEKNTISLDI
jgi:Family of unknown function (DUF5767)